MTDTVTYLETCSTGTETKPVTMTLAEIREVFGDAPCLVLSLVDRLEALTANLAAAQQRWEKLKAKLNCREYSAYVTLNEARDLMADLERGAEGGTQ